ncbi:MAG: hypothetical protein R3E39_15765 [Anaerolineae bacterium]
MAITYHALGQVDDAVRLWKALVAENENFRRPEWLMQEYEWIDSMVDEARKVITTTAS